MFKIYLKLRFKLKKVHYKYALTEKVISCTVVIIVHHVKLENELWAESGLFRNFMNKYRLKQRTEVNMMPFHNAVAVFFLQIVKCICIKIQ
jgi:hypothetical protein